jgi:hypothetical protein
MWNLVSDITGRLQTEHIAKGKKSEVIPVLN